MTSPPSAAAAAPSAEQPLPWSAGERWAGAVLWRGGPLLAGVVVLISLLAAVLVPVQGWRPVIVLPVLALLLTAVLLRGPAPLLRWVPARPAPVWTTAAIVAVSAGHTVWAALTHAEHVVLRRDAGSYALFTQWIATRHGLPIPAQAEAFGGAEAMADEALRLSSPAFFEVAAGSGAQIVPQFLLGAPAVFSLGWWVNGWSGVFVAPAVVSGCALLALGSVAARLIGPRWAVLVVATLAICQPVLHVARSTYSEPVALLVLAAAAALVVDAVRARSVALGWVGGFGVGLIGLVRVDAVREVALLLPVCAALALRGHPAARPLAVGAVTGTAVAAVPAVLLGRPYLVQVAGSLLPLLGLLVVLGLGSYAAVKLRLRLPGLHRRLAGHLTMALVLLVGVVLSSRPLWLTVRQSAADPGSQVVAGLQARQGLPVDGGRTYAEQSVLWLSWYVGPVVLVAALLAFAVLAGRAVRWWQSGSVQVPVWLAPAVVGLGSVVLTLYRPGITPDHPWADRRMVPVVLPAVVLAAGAALAWAGRAALRRWSASVLVAVLVTGAAAMLVPTWVATAPVAGAAARTEIRQLEAVEAVCAALRPTDAVIAVDARGANEWPQVLRGLCGLPSASLDVPKLGPDSSVATRAAALRRLAAGITATGRTPVLLAAEPDGEALIRAAGGAPVPTVDLLSSEAQRYLTRRPDGVDRLVVQVWLARLQ